MKKLLILFFLSLYTFNFSLSQEWFPVGAKWTYEWYWSTGPYYGNYPKYFEVEKDTMILGKSCKKINLIGSQSFSSYRYEENGKVYYYQYTNQSNWHLMYDFSKQIGDTIFFPQFQYAECPSMNLVDYYIIIYNTSEIILGSDTLKTYQAQPMNSCVVGIGEFGTFAIERISGGEVTWYGYDDFSSGPSGLRCYEDSVLGFYKSPGFNLDCDTTVSNVGLDNVLDPGLLSIYPNPAQNTITIRSEIENSDELIFRMFDIHRALLKEFRMSNPSSNFDVSDLKPGMYIYEIESERQFYRNKLLIE
ncbi:T9SS type A sorting domain-containing protein [Hyphobacterium sp. CCMP332]|nr:T9SS type A sorting domain-containing protein [Hyphobacterium sp. CCMP332]